MTALERLKRMVTKGGGSAIDARGGEYVYRFYSSGKGSDWFGACDECGKHVSETWFLTEMKMVTLPEGTIATRHGCKLGCYTGHKECLEKLMR